jgi:hypothetical protein
MMLARSKAWTTRQHPLSGTISFSATDAGDGDITFSINVNANFSGVLSEGGYYLLGGSSFENNIWNNLLNDIQGACIGG